MKIPENPGAYYGNEETGQWQPNGVMVDSGVGGGSVGSGDARVMRPPVYHPVPRPHVPAGYVMAGAYYPPAPFAVAAAPPDNFEDYMWMENEEEFDKQVMQQLEEEALMEQCIEAMLEDEQRERRRPHNGHNHYPTTSNGSPLSLEEAVSRSTLNPLAAEFVPTGARQPSLPPEDRSEPTPPHTEVTKSTESPPSVHPQTTEHTDTLHHTDVKTEEPQLQETPEVSAADITEERIIDKDTKSKDKLKADKKPAKTEAKVKAKVAPKKKEVKVKSEIKSEVKSEVKVEDKVEEIIVEVPKPQPQIEEVSQPGIKPINYAAAARANKPKKPTTPPALEKTQVPLKVERKPEKVTSRKNSAK